MSHTYQLPALFCHTNGQVRWLPSRLVDHSHLLLLLHREQQQQQQQHQQQHLISDLLLPHRVPAVCC